VQQRRGELHALLVAVREFLELRAGAVGEAKAVEPSRRRRIRRLGIESMQTPEVLELLGDGIRG
jgi:hypothetical protein